MLPQGIRQAKLQEARVLHYATTAERCELQQAGGNWIVAMTAPEFSDIPHGDARLFGSSAVETKIVQGFRENRVESRLAKIAIPVCSRREKG